MNSKPSVSIFISAYNEAANIQKVIRSILSQDQTDFEMCELMVFSDGSTDATVDEVRKIQDPRISIFEHQTRIGKSTHLNTFFKTATGDILVFFDADILLNDTHVVSEMIKPIVHDNSVGLVGANAQAQSATGFFEEAVNVTFRAYDELRVVFKGGNNAHGANGCGLALSREFAQSVEIPSNAIANDHFLYHSCRAKGYKFIHQRSAVVWYRSPTNLRDQIKQNVRFIAAHSVLRDRFGNASIQEYAVPKGIMYRLMWKQFIRKPIHVLFIFVINRYCQMRARMVYKELGATWAMATSTKQDIKIG